MRHKNKLQYLVTDGLLCKYAVTISTVCSVIVIYYISTNLSYAFGKSLNQVLLCFNFTTRNSTRRVGFLNAAQNG